MNFASDNTGPAHPKVMEALIQANEGASASYGADARDDEAVARVRAVSYTHLTLPTTSRV